MVERQLCRRVVAIFGVIAISTIAAGAAGRANPDRVSRTGPSQLEPFDALVGGAWHLDGSYQVFEWGVGRELVRAKSYAIAGADTSLVSEGMWFWHPGEDAIQGLVAAVGMPISLFEYVTRVEGDRFSHQLTAYGDMGGAYTEEWDLTDANHYQWTLYDGPAPAGSPMMSGTFERVSWPDE